MEDVDGDHAATMRNEEVKAETRLDKVEMYAQRKKIRKTASLNQHAAAYIVQPPNSYAGKLLLRR